MKYRHIITWDAKFSRPFFDAEWLSYSLNGYHILLLQCSIHANWTLDLKCT